ncbi:MAG TPA: group III truncated hemoglobin [Chitinophagales bacterium]|nr:group III truncated hemoglobin [Chitinophagales bacterium]HMX03671.1 group III truncated hemoglobin [Chitinophagales bacterium]HMZ87823.1 group III truncated hemoglobin [Chitinophagales bacterium]HNA57294.1 group III truncated hemoglobin [Chitinophagales bacterium]HNE45635.1 group III truncated hemoglobin [Chitinophagales bacterium]
MQDITSRSDVAKIVVEFYNDVRRDELLAYIFNDVAQVNWETHTPLIIDFWEYTVLGTGSYTRNAMTPHVALHAKSPLTQAHFDRWLQLFHATVDKYFAGENADLMKTRADGIAGLMHHKLNG